MTDHIGEATQKVIDLDTLEKLADEAGGKSWTLGGGGFVVEGDRPIADFLAQTDPEDWKSAPSLGDAFERANFVAAASPATIKALIAELKEARGLVEQSIDLMTDEYEDTKAHQQQARAFLARNGKGEG